MKTIRIANLPPGRALELPLAALHTPYIFPTENGLRCNTRQLTLGQHQLDGDFHFGVSRYSQTQLRETSHHHLLREEPAAG
jgi:beta-galactosidase